MNTFRSLDLNLMRVFAAVMVERHVTRAASQLAMSQPAVSNALRRLRETTGDELFVTVPNGVAPTPRAEALWPDVRQAMDSLRSAFDGADFDPAGDAATFSLAMADATATVVAPALLAALAEQAAKAELRVLPLASRDPRPQLEQASADAAIGFFPEVARALAADGASASTVLDPLYRCEYVCVMRRQHPLAEAEALDVDAYCAATHVRVSFAGRPRGFVDEVLAAAGRERRVVLTVNAFATAARVVHDADLLTVLPKSFVPASGLGDGLVTRPFPGTLPRIEVGLLWHRRHERDAAHRWLRRTVIAALRRG